jgi:ectoine hydroxylase-related dioxygenase (phytanoyl-CoA dioxygenase family)
MPSHLNTDPARFGELGYCLFRDVLTAEETRRLRAMLDEALGDPLPQPPGRDGAMDRDNYVGEPHVRDLRWLDLCRHPRVLDAIESILGPNLILVYSSVFIKLPASPVEVGWHQDNTYWPSVHGTDVITLWLAVDDADAANSAMKVIPGSHRGWMELETVDSGANQMLRRSVPVSPEQEGSAVTLEMSAGSLSIHDSFLLHGSDANRSRRRRAGYTIRYCSTDTAWVDLDNHPHPVFLVRGLAGPRGDRYTCLLPAEEATWELLRKS